MQMHNKFYALVLWAVFSALAKGVLNQNLGHSGIWTDSFTKELIFLGRGDTYLVTAFLPVCLVLTLGSLHIPDPR